MSVGIEYFNVIVPISVIEKRYPGGWDQCKKNLCCNEQGSPNCSDEYLLRQGAMSGFDIELIVADWESLGLKRYKGAGANRKWRDLCVFDSLDEIPSNCDWLTIGDDPQTVCLKPGCII
jgi:hypothetical protein